MSNVIDILTMIAESVNKMDSTINHKDYRLLSVILGMDAFKGHDIAEWHEWQAHVPLIIREQWGKLGIETRLSVYLTAKAVTYYTDKERGVENEVS